MQMKAAIDIGTNTTRMLIGEVKDGKVNVQAQFILEPRLGEGISEGRLTPEAMARTLRALAEFKKVTREYQIQEVSLAATSAVRDAVNKKEFVDAVFKETGWQVEIIDGIEEAFLSFTGAVSVLPPDTTLPVIVDIGGGSTEVIFQSEGQVKGTSVNVGAVRLKETSWSAEELNRRLLPALRDLMEYKEKITLVAVGGTATTAAAVLYGIKNYSRAAVQGKTLTFGEIKGLRDKLAAMTPEERKKVPGLSPKRADIIIPGLDILTGIMGQLGATRVVISDAGILDGILLTR